MRILLAVLALAALPVAGGTVRTWECARPDCVMVPESDIRDLVDTNDRGWARVAELEQRIAEMEASGPRCAKVEVTEPPKRQIPPLKKEIDG